MLPLVFPILRASHASSRVSFLFSSDDSSDRASPLMLPLALLLSCFPSRFSHASLLKLPLALSLALLLSCFFALLSGAVYASYFYGDGSHLLNLANNQIIQSIMENITALFSLCNHSNPISTPAPAPAAGATAAPNLPTTFISNPLSIINMRACCMICL